MEYLGSKLLSKQVHLKTTDCFLFKSSSDDIQVFLLFFKMVKMVPYIPPLRHKHHKTASNDKAEQKH